jgi:hypothetical protein
MSSPIGCPVVSFLSTLDGDVRVPGFRARGAKMGTVRDHTRTDDGEAALPLTGAGNENTPC